MSKTLNIKYTEAGGLFFHEETNAAVVKVILEARERKLRLRIDLGDAKTGQSWSEENGIHGYVGRSTGEIKVPLLIANTRSLGGGALLDHCIVRIWNSKTKELLYDHPNYQPKYDWAKSEVKKSTPESHPYKVVATPYPSGTPEVIAGFTDEGQAERWLKRKRTYETPTVK